MDVCSNKMDQTSKYMCLISSLISFKLQCVILPLTYPCQIQMD